ncbi:MAG: vanadium-dependent haloperoxidase [Clostridiaceae bacterium]
MVAGLHNTKTRLAEQNYLKDASSDKVTDNNLKWSKIPYPDQTNFPEGETQEASNWYLNFFKRDSQGKFFDLKGKQIQFGIVPSKRIDFKGSELTLVKLVSENLNQEKIDLSYYWGTGNGIKQFLNLVDILIETYNVPLLYSTRIYSILTQAIQDAMSITWFFKYYFDVPRPVQLDKNFIPILKTPVYPSYPAGHSVLAGVVEVILSYFFEAESIKIHDITEQCSISRLYAGIHYPIDLTQGLNLGREIGDHIITQIKTEKDITGAEYLVKYSEYRDAKLTSNL